MRLPHTMCILTLAALPWAHAHAAKIPLTILHTNDLHSHYRPDKGPFGLGGVARIATTVRRIRESARNTLLLDGGDWSEGQIYYNLGAGRTALEMLGALGYDATVLGNHDWLNGPDQLLALLRANPPRYAMLAANIDLTAYPNGQELSRYVQPYRILSVGGLRIAIIGLVTYELIYDKFFAPVRILDPFGVTRRLAARLKSEADLVVVISHNGMSINRLVAGLPNVDLVIHAHDHLKLAKPVEVRRNGKTALLVEAGQWGEYVGRLDLTVDTDTKRPTIDHYELIQMDKSVPEDAGVAAMVDRYDSELVGRYGDIFHDHVADSEIEIRRDGSESLYGNLLTDAYREATGAEVSFEQVSLTSGMIEAGPVNSADIYNALTAFYSETTGKAWTLTTLKMTGATLSWILNLILGITPYIPGGIVNTSGLHAVFDASIAGKGNIYEDSRRKSLVSLEIGGLPVEPMRAYTVALPHGLIEAIEFIERFFGRSIERTEVQDTGIEDWRAAAAYLRRHSPIRAGEIPRGGRFTPLQPDLALYHDDIVARRDDLRLQLDLRVRNLGARASSARRLWISYDRTPLDTRDDPNPSDPVFTAEVHPVPSGGEERVQASFSLPEEMRGLPLILYLDLDRASEDPNPSNDGTWLYL